MLDTAKPGSGLFLFGVKWTFNSMLKEATMRGKKKTQERMEMLLQDYKLMLTIRNKIEKRESSPLPPSPPAPIEIIEITSNWIISWNTCFWSVTFSFHWQQATRSVDIVLLLCDDSG